jgi:hypothetical protein
VPCGAVQCLWWMARGQAVCTPLQLCWLDGRLVDCQNLQMVCTCIRVARTLVSCMHWQHSVQHRCNPTRVTTVIYACRAG